MREREGETQRDRKRERVRGWVWGKVLQEEIRMEMAQRD